MLVIRPEIPEDAAAIRQVNKEVFGGRDEAFMVLGLRQGALDRQSGTVKFRPEFRGG